MTRIFNRALVAVGLGAIAMAAQAQGGWSACDANMNSHTVPYDIGLRVMENPIARVAMDLAGTVTHGGSFTATPPDPCWDPAHVGQGRGGFALSAGIQGSIQSDFDNNMAFTYGAPLEPAIPWCFATINNDNVRTAFGTNGLSFVFIASGTDSQGNPKPPRAWISQTVQGTDFVELRVDLLADAVRYQWTITNNGTAAHSYGVWFGAWVAMLSDQTGESSGGAGLPFGSTNIPFVTIPGRRPLATQLRINRNTDQNFPDFENFYFDQARPFGLRLENGPTLATANPDGNGSDADFVDEVAFGDPVQLLGGWDGAQIFTDVVQPLADWGSGPLGDTAAFLQKFREKNILVGANATFIHYVRSPWGVSNYSDPYSVCIDGPTLIPTDNAQPSGLKADGQFQLAVNIDNTARPGFTNVNKPGPIQSVRVDISFPNLPNGDLNGLGLASGETATKTITSNSGPALPTLIMKTVTYNLVADGVASGNLPYTIKVTPTTGPVKTLTGTVTVAATPREKLFSSPTVNLVTAPWQFADSSWESVLGLDASQFAAFEWDPQQNGYVLSTAAERGKGQWIVYFGNDPSINAGTNFYQSNPQQPDDLRAGAPQVRLHSGWNLIGNPYNYSFPLNQIVGVSDQDNTETLTWQELVNTGIVSNFLAYWDPSLGAYRYVQDINDDVRPNVGYWVFVQGVNNDLTILWPPVFAPGLPNDGGPIAHTRTNSVGSTPATALWKLQLVARSSFGIDDQNFVGAANSASSATRLSILKPPMSPVSDLRLVVTPTTGTNKTAYASLLTASTGAQDYSVVVSSKKGGTVVLSWPTITTLPTTTAVSVTDTSNNQTQDMRRAASYVFSLAKNSSRTLTVHVKPVAPANIITSISKTLGNGTINFSYKLATAATTTTKIMTGAGRDVVTLTTNRHDIAGLNKVTWNLRDSTNHAVPTGTYVIVVSATNSLGQTDTQQLQFNR